MPALLVSSSESKQTADLFVPVDISKDRDGRVLKRIIKFGKGRDFPLVGDTVLVNYKAVLSDGTPVQPYQGDGKCFQFTLGKGAVVQGFDWCVSTMCRGEIAEVYCQSCYAYGTAGLPPVVPANVDLQFEIELISWSGEDISKRKDGGITKSVITPGRRQGIPNIGASCNVHIVGRVDEREFENRDVSLVLGEGSENEIIPAIEYAIKRMKDGEKIRLVVKPSYVSLPDYCSKHRLKSDTDVVYEVELKSFTKVKECWELENEEKLTEAFNYKERGTRYFKQEKFKLAKLNYKKVIQLLGFVPRLSAEEHKKWTDLLVAGHLNLAMCYLKLEDFLSARDSSSSALEHDASNEKAFYRRGLANLGLQDFNQADIDFHEVLKLNRRNTAARQQLTKVKEKMEQAKDKDRQTYAGMFKKFADHDLKKEGVVPPVDVFSTPGEWSNEMAKDMMTLEQEMAAFGEKLPESMYNKKYDKENLDPQDD